MGKIYKTAPLPFQGQKRRFVSAFILAMTELKNKQDIKIVVDLFGGSGLLSHISKQILPDALVIYNDFDNYSTRLKHIVETNNLISDIRLFIGNYPKAKKIDAVCRNKIIERIEKEPGYIDFITLSSSLLFSAKYVVNMADLKAETLYNNVKKTDYDVDPDIYLKGLDIVHCDYQLLFNQYKDLPGVLFIIDPPYLSTDTTTYHSDKYWKLRDYLDVLNVLVGSNYVFFTSNKSSLVELCEWFADNRDIGNPFKNSVLNTQNVTLNQTSSYTDMMLYKFIK